MDKICIVFDLDETLIHYFPENVQTQFDFESHILEKDDIVVFRPGLKEFIDYVKSKNGKIILGIWTYGTEGYANKIVEKIEKKYNNGQKLFEFIYSREDMKPGMLDKELDFIIENNSHLNLNKTNTYLVDNRPDNIYHDKNIKNGKMVESFVNKKLSVDMFEHLKKIYDSLLSTSKIPPEYKKEFTVNGNIKEICCIGENFDDGLQPNIIGGKKISSKQNSGKKRKITRKRNKRNQKQTFRLIKK